MHQTKAIGFCVPALTAAVLLIACNTPRGEIRAIGVDTGQTDVVHLENAEGATAICGPYTDLPGVRDTLTDQAELQACVSRYQRQGYAQMPVR